VEGNAIQLKDIPIRFRWRSKKIAGEKLKLMNQTLPEFMPQAARIAGRPFWNPHRAQFGPIPLKEGKVRKPPLVRESEGIFGKFPGVKTRVDISMEEEDDEAFQGGSESDFPPLSPTEGILCPHPPFSSRVGGSSSFPQPRDKIQIQIDRFVGYFRSNPSKPKPRSYAQAVRSELPVGRMAPPTASPTGGGEKEEGAEEVALELAGAVVERVVLVAGPAGPKPELSSGSVLVNFSSGVREIGQRRMALNMKVSITIIIKRLRILRCKWRKGNTHRRRMVLLPTRNKLLRKAKGRVELKKLEIRTDGVGIPTTCMKGVRTLNQERISNLMLLKVRLVLREGLVAFTMGLRIIHLKNVERNLPGRCVA
jgi:hypothetical protein